MALCSLLQDSLYRGIDAVDTARTVRDLAQSSKSGQFFQIGPDSAGIAIIRSDSEIEPSNFWNFTILIGFEKLPFNLSRAPIEHMHCDDFGTAPRERRQEENFNKKPLILP